MKKECYKEITVSDELNMKLKYYLLTDNIREEYCDLKVYGAEIRKDCIFPDGKCETEQRSIKNLFFRRSEAEQFLGMLTKNQVTPMGLVSAVSEHIDRQLQKISCE